MKTFSKSFTQQEPIPLAAIERAVAAIRGVLAEMPAAA